MITSAALRCGFGGGLVVDYPHSTKASEALFSCLCTLCQMLCGGARAYMVSHRDYCQKKECSTALISCQIFTVSSTRQSMLQHYLEHELLMQLIGTRISKHPDFSSKPNTCATPFRAGYINDQPEMISLELFRAKSMCSVAN